MNPELSGFALGLLFGAAKVMAIGTVGFAIAWWRARRKIRELEAERPETVSDEGLRGLEERFERIEGQLSQLIDSHDALRAQLIDRPPEPRRLGQATPTN
ncbi:MAG TPA: hypothetical protein VJU15_04015 [Gemmatimonadales bacterium]|nr:hypothetical protein [Gemmatimonadales bacterium]